MPSMSPRASITQHSSGAHRCRTRLASPSRRTLSAIPRGSARGRSWPWIQPSVGGRPTAGRRVGSGPRGPQAPPPRRADQVAAAGTSCTAATIGSSARQSAIPTAKTPRPIATLLVPSSGSTSQVHGPLPGSSPNSSERIRWCGNARRRRATISASEARSRSVTRSPWVPLSCTSNGLEARERNSAPAASAASVATAQACCRSMRSLPSIAIPSAACQTGPGCSSLRSTGRPGRRQRRGRARRGAAAVYGDPGSAAPPDGPDRGGIPRGP